MSKLKPGKAKTWTDGRLHCSQRRTRTIPFLKKFCRLKHYNDFLAVTVGNGDNEVGKHNTFFLALQILQSARTYHEWIGLGGNGRIIELRKWVVGNTNKPAAPPL